MISKIGSTSLQMKVGDEWVDLSGALTSIQIPADDDVVDGPFDLDRDFSFTCKFYVSPMQIAKFVYRINRIQGSGRRVSLWRALRALLDRSMARFSIWERRSMADKDGAIGGG